MQTATSRIWTRVEVSISFEDLQLQSPPSGKKRCPGIDSKLYDVDVSAHDIAITPRSTLSRSNSSSYIPSMGEIDLFKNCSYSMGILYAI